MKNNILQLFLILSAILLVFSFLSCEQPETVDDDDDSQSTGAKMKIIDSEGTVGICTSIAADNNGVYLSYYDGSNADLKFARSTDNGATWLNENMKIVDSDNGVGTESSIAVDGANIYISYRDLSNGNLKFAKSVNSGSTWLASNIKVVDATDDVGTGTSLAVIGSNIYIAYLDQTNYNLKFTKSTDSGATWPAAAIKTVDSAGNVGQSPSIAVNGSNIYISYYDITNEDLKFAKSVDDGATWLPANIKTVDSTNNTGNYSSIAVDGTYVYISYNLVSFDCLKFAKSIDSGATWSKEIIDSSGQVGRYTSLKADGSIIYIAYWDLTNKSVKFAKSSDRGDTWPSNNFKLIDPSGNTGQFSSLAFYSNNVYISSYDEINQDCMFIRSTDAGTTWIK